jgi:2-methylisocitrate lyase-like PEP mutase family enzyme
MKKSTQLKQMINSGKIVVLPGAYDALGAKLIEQAGFSGVYMSGSAVTASLLGLPDVGMITGTEMINAVTYMAKATSLPLLADGDTGYGDNKTVYRTIKEYILAGAAGIQLEDQTLSKKCGHMSGKKVVSTEEMLKRIKAADLARKEMNDPDFVLAIRTDAYAVEGFESAIERCQEYAKAGADLVFPVGLHDVEEYKTFLAKVDCPTMIDVVENSAVPYLTIQELEKLGFALVIFPLAGIFGNVYSMKNLFKEIKETGLSREASKRMVSFAEYNQVLRQDLIDELENNIENI